MIEKKPKNSEMSGVPTLSISHFSFVFAVCFRPARWLYKKSNDGEDDEEDGDDDEAMATMTNMMQLCWFVACFSIFIVVILVFRPARWHVHVIVQCHQMRSAFQKIP